jgi:hypothetical protein
MVSNELDNFIPVRRLMHETGGVLPETTRRVAQAARYKRTLR